MRIAILLNSGAGRLDRAGCEARIRQIREVFTALGVQTEILLCSPARLTRAARQFAAHGFDAVVAAGGDGTVSAVANGLAGTAMPLAVLPFGTLNHFARDIGMPTALADAAAAIRDGTTERIDVGEVNGRLFVNNSSLGLYSEAVIVRDDHRRRRGMRKWSAMLMAAVRVLWRFPLLAISVETTERKVVTKTPFVFVGNNDYSTNIRSLGRRATIDRGTLCVHTIRARGRFSMLWLVVRAMIGRRDIPNLETQRQTEAWVRSRHRHLAVAVDGEVLRMRPPLHYRIRPGALLVRRAHAEAAVAQLPRAIGGT